MVQLRCIAEPRKRTEYIMPKITLRKLKFWAKVADKVDVLLCNIKLSKVALLKAGKDSVFAPEMCIVAPIYCKLSEKPINYWLPYFFDEIKENAYDLHTKTKFSYKISKAIAICPNTVYPEFIVGLYKVEIFIGEPCFYGTDINSLDLNTIEKLIKENDFAVLVTENKRFISFWYIGKLFLCYSPPQGFGKNLEYSFILKSKNFQDLYNYLKNNIQFEGSYEIFSVRILKKIPIILDLNEIFKERENRIMNRVADTETVIDGDKDIILEENEKNIIIPGEPIEMDDIDRSSDTFRIPFSKDYANQYYSDRGFLNGTVGLYVRESEKIINTNIAAAIYLHNIRAALWTKQTIDDILCLGDKLYEESVKKGIADDIYWINRIPQPITFGARKFKLIFEKIIIGDITTEENFIFSVKQGIAAFFKHSDLGIIYGPQPQLIWQEAGLYFTFSPKERDPVGRKWTRALSSRLVENTDSKELPTQGSACVSWFKDLICLCDAYIANIVLKHRKDQYRLVKIKIYEEQNISEDDKNWKSYAPGKWRIIGDKTICHYIQNTENGLAQIFPKSFTIACANSLYTKVYNPDDWKSENIDEILEYGNDYYKESVHENSTLLNDFNFKGLKRTFVLAGKRFQIVIAANKYQGQVFYSKGNAPDLAKALKFYFDDYQFGLILLGERILPIFQMNSYYHLLFVYDKVFGKTDACVCNADNIYGDVYGHAFALRFKDITAMYEEILTIMSLNDDEKYSLYIVEGKDRPPLLNYKQFGEYAAILRPNDGMHEGSDMFNVRADKQTYANILVTLCYVNMSRPLEWSPEDVADLLKTGDSIYCKITSNLKKCNEIYYKLKLEDITPYIGWNKFNYSINTCEGIFKLYPEMEEEQEIEGENEIIDEEQNPITIKDELKIIPELENVLNEWEGLEQVQAILDSRIIKLGLWKKDLVYFVFDPKASLEDGKLTPRRIQRAATTIEYGDNDITDLRYIKNDGSAYIAYFYDLKSFIEHLLSCIPQDYHTENFTLNTLKIICPPVPLSEIDIKYMPNTNFIITSSNIGIIRATISQDEIMFQNPNKQEIANCMVAIAFAFITAPNKWTSELVNIILKYGDRLYIKSLDRFEKKEYDPIIGIKNSLTIDDIIKNVNIYKVLFKFTIVAQLTNCINPGGETNKDIKKLFSRLQNIDNGSGAIIKIKDRTNTVWKQGTTYFLFDPFKCDPIGLTATNGVACLMRFSKFELFMEFFIKKFLCKDGPNNFEMILLYCEKSMPSSIPGFYLNKYNFTLQKPSHQVGFEDTENGMKIMKRFIDPKNKSIRFLCLAALLYSRVEYVELWNFYVFERIVLLSEFLRQQLELKTSIPNSNHLEDINFSIKIDNILFNIVVHHIIQVTSTTELDSKNLNMRQGLQGFFIEHNNCIITSDTKCYAIWYEGPKYYMIWFKESDSKLTLLISPNWMNFYDIILGEVELNASTYYIKKVTITRIKMIDTCDEEGKNITNKLNDVDEKCRECSFTQFIEEYLSRNELKNKLDAKFKPYSQGVSILCGDFIKTNEFITSDLLFCENLKACCITTAAMFLILHPVLWEKSTLQQIVSTGTDLFRSYSVFCKKTQFELTDYQNNMNFLNYNVCIEPQTPTIEDFELNNLLNPIEYYLKKSKIAYIGVEQQFYMTIMLHEHRYYMFYGGAAPSYIEHLESETTCLIRADSLIKLLQFLIKKHRTNDPALVGQINAKIL